LFIRYTTNAVDVLPLATTHGEIVAIGTELAAAAALTIGLFAPLAALTLFIVQWRADQMLLSWSLASVVIQIMLLAFACLPVGTRLSIDGRFRQKLPWRFVYGFWGTPSVERATFLRWLAFLSYALVSLSAFEFHLRDHAWSSGVAQAYVFTNPYFSGVADSARRFALSSPNGVLAFSRAIGYAMLSWEALMLPLVAAGRIGRRIVVAYGVLFFLVSALTLHLLWLPYVELLLWTLIFWAGPPLSTASRLPRSDWRIALVALAYIAAAGGALASLPWPGFANPVPSLSKLIGVINVSVFNEQDLRTNESYATVTRLGPDETRSVVPLNGEHGDRLAWHRSERVFYGISLPWRRTRAGRASECWSEALDRRPVDDLVRLDRARGAPANATYEITFYADRLLDPYARGSIVFRAMETCRVGYDPASGAAVAR
jgi:hypothetical protein